jgi:ABC-2 type transport system ATP-binding protein
VGLWYHLPRREYRRRAQEMLELLSLTDAADRRVKTYSGGMRRRLDVGASLIANSPVLFLDEPTTGLDPRTRNDLWQFVRDLVNAGTTVLLTTQYMEEAEHLANRIVVIDKGKEIAAGTADELKTQTGGATLEARVADPRDIDRAAALLAGVARAQPRSDPEARLVSIPAGEGTGLLLDAGRRLQEAGIALDDLGIRRSTLDEVFLSLTGASSQDRAGAPKAEATT